MKFPLKKSHTRIENLTLIFKLLFLQSIATFTFVIPLGLFCSGLFISLSFDAHFFRTYCLEIKVVQVGESQRVRKKLFSNIYPTDSDFRCEYVFFLVLDVFPSSFFI